MTFNPMGGELVSAGLTVQTLPEIEIHHRFTVRFFPSFGFPSWHPLAQSFKNVLAVGINRHSTGLREALERINHRQQFHAIVRAGGFAPRSNDVRTVGLPKDGGPTAWTGIAETGPVREELISARRHFDSTRFLCSV